MADEKDTEISSSTSQAALTTPIRAGELKKGMMAMLKGFPCKIIEITTSKTGKHGHAKANITGIDIFTGQKKVDISPTSHTMTQPVVVNITLQLTDITDDDYCSCMDEDGEMREDLKMPDAKSSDPQLGDNIRQALADSETNGKDVLVIITKAPMSSSAKAASEVITAYKVGMEA